MTSEERSKAPFLGAGWQPMSTAPKDGTPIVGLCRHDSDPYRSTSDGDTLTPYGAHCEGLGRVPDGPHVIVWGGMYSDVLHELGRPIFIPPWWFRFGSDFEDVASPVGWMPIPEAESAT